MNLREYISIYKSVSNHYHQNLLCLDDDHDINKYIKKRQLNKDTIQKFQLGYSDGKIKSLKINVDDLKEVGILNGKGNDKMYKRLLFPIFNISGKVIGFAGRDLESEKEFKYLNTSDTIGFKKKEILYGLNFARDYIREKNKVMLVEGQMDVISLMQEGINNVVASSGTSFTTEQANLIKLYTDNVIVIFDNDEGGKKSTIRVIDILVEKGFNIEIISLPENEDPDSYIKKYGKDKFLKLKTKSFDLFLKNSVCKKELKEKLAEQIKYYPKNLIKQFI